MEVAGYTTETTASDSANSTTKDAKVYKQHPESKSKKHRSSSKSKSKKKSSKKRSKSHSKTEESAIATVGTAENRIVPVIEQNPFAYKGDVRLGKDMKVLAQGFNLDKNTMTMLAYYDACLLYTSPSPRD